MATYIRHFLVSTGAATAGTGDALKLTGGAKIEIGYRPFSTDATTTGATYEMEILCSSVTDRQGVILDCMAGDIGFQMTTEQALMRVSGGTEVSTKFASDMNLKWPLLSGPRPVSGCWNFM